MVACSQVNLERRKVAGVLRDPLPGSFLGIELSAFYPFNLLAVMFYMADLFDHAQAKNVSRIFKLDPDFETGTGGFAPDYVTGQKIVLVENWDANAYALE